MAHSDNILRAEPIGSNNARIVNWSALAVGAFTFFAFQFCFTLLGSAIGFSNYDRTIEFPSTGSLILAGLYMLVTISASFFSAGYISSRFAEFRRGRNSFLQGFSTWALITAVTAYVLTSGMGSLMGGLGSMTNLLMQGSAFLFLSFTLGMASCVFGAVLNHRWRYRIETRLGKWIDSEPPAARPRRIA